MRQEPILDSLLAINGVFGRNKESPPVGPLGLARPREDELNPAGCDSGAGCAAAGPHWGHVGLEEPFCRVYGAVALPDGAALYGPLPFKKGSRKGPRDRKGGLLLLLASWHFWIPVRADLGRG